MVAERNIYRELGHRIMVLDGAMGTMIQSYGLEEKDYRGERFRSHGHLLRGNNDLLSMTRPDIIRTIHDAYLDAGADIIETNTFNANRISMADYGLEDVVYEMNLVSARIAREAADFYTSRDPSRPRFVAGSMGPTNKTASLSSDMENPGSRAVSFDQLGEAYYEQARGLVDGGADILLVETVFDTLNAKAALFALQKLFRSSGKELPVMLSVTLNDASGRTLSGQTLQAFLTSVGHVRLLSIGLNCSQGAREMGPFLEELSETCPIPVSVYPNAGLPNQFGGYDETPGETAALMEDFLKRGLANIIGGCCGTTPEHIRKLTLLAGRMKRRQPPQIPVQLRLSGLEALVQFNGSNFINIGERTNVAGSRQFAGMIREERYEDALAVARQQVENGAQILDVNMDDAMLDSGKAMRTFLYLLSDDPSIARIPVMIDSSNWSVLEAGLKCLQGKAIVNSISLKEGEVQFLEHARKTKDYGAAVVVMAFDEKGQAASFERKIEICSRSYRLLTGNAGFPPQDIIFDPNILTIGTGMAEHNGYALDFLRAVRWIRENLPHARVSGGISNLSFSFRGNNTVREAMHSAFLFHAVRAGLDMGIVNAGALPLYDQIPADLLEHVEDLILNRRPDATDRLVTLANSLKSVKKETTRAQEWRNASLEKRIVQSLVLGIPDYVETDMEEALAFYPRALDIIEGPMMDGMDQVGDLFASGKMFLPQVIRSARVMKKAVAWLEPYIGKEKGGKPGKAGKVLLATVKGDVHDIGKNIVGIVLACNNFRIIDLGVMNPVEKILDAARKEKVDMIGLSGLITPSLEEMVHVAREMKRQGFTIPLLIGGAASSVMHTAVKIQPEYPHGVIHVRDASRSVPVVNSLASKNKASGILEETSRKYADLRAMNSGLKRNFVTLEEARTNRPDLRWEEYDPPVPVTTGIQRFTDYNLEELTDYIDWTFFYHVWEMKGRFPELLDHPVKGKEAGKLYDDARKMLERIIRDRGLRAQAVLGIFPASSRGDDIVVYAEKERKKEVLILPQLRQQGEKIPDGSHTSLSDFIAPEGSGKKDHIGMIVATAGVGLEEYIRPMEREYDDYSVIMVRALADRLAEALVERLHERIRKEFWAFSPDENLSKRDLFLSRYRGVRPAYGYPACPDHSEKRKIFSFLDVEGTTGISLTEKHAIYPTASVCCLVFSHPSSGYIEVGKISADQVRDYSRRKGDPVVVTERHLSHILNYK